jgi:MGT family glycosyltransferase
MGTLFHADAAFFPEVFAAFEHEDVQVLISAGPCASDASLTAPPPNVTVAASVPQLDVLLQAAVFVTHGGMNSVSENLSSGVPLVVIPATSEQAIIGRRVEALGAGLFVAREAAGATRLRQAVRTVLADDGFRRPAGAVRASFSSAGGVVRGAAAVSNHVRRNAR